MQIPSDAANLRLNLQRRVDMDVDKCMHERMWVRLVFSNILQVWGLPFHNTALPSSLAIVLSVVNILGGLAAEAAAETETDSPMICIRTFPVSKGNVNVSAMHAAEPPARNNLPILSQRQTVIQNSGFARHDNITIHEFLFTHPSFSLPQRLWTAAAHFGSFPNPSFL